jgi:hypothetical protein
LIKSQIGGSDRLGFRPFEIASKSIENSPKPLAFWWGKAYDEGDGSWTRSLAKNRSWKANECMKKGGSHDARRQETRCQTGSETGCETRSETGRQTRSQTDTETRQEVS